jgi:hypothetical protein
LQISRNPTTSLEYFQAADVRQLAQSAANFCLALSSIGANHPFRHRASAQS